MEKFDKRIMNMLMEDCELTEEYISTMTKGEALEAILTYEGFIGYTSWIIRLIEDIYDVTLE